MCSFLRWWKVILWFTSPTYVLWPTKSENLCEIPYNKITTALTWQQSWNLTKLILTCARFSNEHYGAKVSHKNAVETYLGETNVTRTFNSFEKGTRFDNKCLLLGYISSKWIELKIVLLRLIFNSMSICLHHSLEYLEKLFPQPRNSRWSIPT